MIARKARTVRGVPVRFWKAVDESLGRAWSRIATKLRWAPMDRNTRKLGRLIEYRRDRHGQMPILPLLRKTAFFVLRRFFNQQVRATSGVHGERPVARAEFGRFLPNDLRGAVAEFFLSAGWLTLSQAPSGASGPGSFASQRTCGRPSPANLSSSSHRESGGFVVAAPSATGCKNKGHDWWRGRWVGRAARRVQRGPSGPRRHPRRSPSRRKNRP